MHGRTNLETLEKLGNYGKTFCFQLEVGRWMSMYNLVYWGPFVDRPKRIEIASNPPRSLVDRWGRSPNRWSLKFLFEYFFALSSAILSRCYTFTYIFKYFQTFTCKFTISYLYNKYCSAYRALLLLNFSVMIAEVWLVILFNNRIYRYSWCLCAVSNRN